MSSKFKLFEAVLQKNRIQIINALSDGKARYVSELAKETKLTRVNVCYHLDVLKEAGLVEQEYKILKEPGSVGKVGSFYKLNIEKLRKAIDVIRKMLPETKP